MYLFTYLLLFSYFILIYSEYTDSPLDTETPIVPPVFPELQLLKKFQTVRVSADDGLIQFDSAGFANNEEMHFKIKALNNPGNFYEEKISYEYVNSPENYVKEDMRDSPFTSIIDYEMRDDGTRFKIRYFDIQKNKNQFRSSSGNVLLIAFYIREGVVEITNIEEKKGDKGLKGWEISLIVISVILFVIIIIIIIVYLIKKKNKRKSRKNKHKHRNNYYYNEFYQNNDNEDKISEYEQNQQEIRIYNRRRPARIYNDYIHNREHHFIDNNYNETYKYNPKYDVNEYKQKNKSQKNTNRSNSKYDLAVSSISKFQYNNGTTNKNIEFNQPNKKHK